MFTVAAFGIQRQRRTAHVDAVKGRRRRFQINAAAQTPHWRSFCKLQVCAIAIQR